MRLKQNKSELLIERLIKIIIETDEKVRHDLDKGSKNLDKYLKIIVLNS